MRIQRIVLIMIVLLYGQMALADCTYNGVRYPSGTKLGPYVCSGTQWVIQR